MIIAKYNSKKDKGIMVSESEVTNVVEKAGEVVVQKAQQVAAQTTSEIAMTATIDANGDLIMETDIAVAVAQTAST